MSTEIKHATKQQMKDLEQAIRAYKEKNGIDEPFFKDLFYDLFLKDIMIK
ncbi:MAG: hypothetical protein JWQ09_2965 [Segetibacter sp.]|nr:hypothetical protein [Segetibacter sp.]